MNEEPIKDIVVMDRNTILEALQRTYTTGQPGLLSTRQIAWMEQEGLIERLADYSYRVTTKGENEWMKPYERDVVTYELDATEDWLR
jgi:hypothetical protein